MSNIHDTLNAIREATEAFDRIPELEARIRKLEEDLAFAQLESEEYRGTITQLRNRVDEVVLHNNRLEEDLRDKLDHNGELEAKIYELTSAHNSAQARIRDLENDKETAAIMISLLEADKAALTSRLADFSAMETRLRDALSRAFPVAQEVATNTFRHPDTPESEPVSSFNVPPKPLVEAVRVASEVVEGDLPTQYGEYGYSSLRLG